MPRVLPLLEIAPALPAAEDEPGTVAGELLELVLEDAAAVDLQGRVAAAPHALDDLDGVQRVLLPVQPPCPDDPDRLLGLEGARRRRRKLAKRIRNVRGSYAVPPARTGDAGARQRDRQRDAQRRSGEEPLEGRPEHAVVEERARGEGRARAVQDEDHLASA